MTTDLVVIGGGPAGAALALRAAGSGLRVILLEGARFPRRKPGETLHPGVEPILRQIGVWAQVGAAGFHRHRGVWLKGRGDRVFQEYGADADGPWLGIQAERSVFDAILLDALKRKKGALVLQPCRALAVLKRNGRAAGLSTSQGEIFARWIVDAGGGSHWMARQLDIPVLPCSRPLSIRFGWSSRDPGENSDLNPLFSLTSDGWQWHAPLRPGHHAWCRLYFNKASASLSGPRNGGSCDVTWRCVEKAAGPGWFIAGDAAAVVDPASSHGVLRALMSGVMAAHAIQEVESGCCETEAASAAYSNWVRLQFARDVAALKTFYAKHPYGPNPGFPDTTGHLQSGAWPIAGYDSGGE